MIEKTGEGNFNARIVYDDRDEFAFFYKKLNENESEPANVDS